MAVLAGCRTIDGSVEVKGAGEMDLSPLQVEVVTGDLTIGPTFGVDVVSLDGLRSVGGRLRVVSNGVATGVYLPALEHAGAVEVAANVGCAGVALPALREVDGDLVVEGNPVMENLGLGMLERVGGTLRIRDNRTLAIVEVGAAHAGAVDVEGGALPEDTAARLRAIAP